MTVKEGLAYLKVHRPDLQLVRAMSMRTMTSTTTMEQDGRTAIGQALCRRKRDALIEIALATLADRSIDPHEHVLARQRFRPDDN